MKETPLSELTFAQFTSQCHSKFAVPTGPGTAVELELVQADLQRPRRSASAARVECFSLVFVGPSAPLLPQGTYRFEHPVLGTFSIFIVPISQDRQRACYEAVFNRRVAP
jgi:hypothetical protein